MYRFIPLLLLSLIFTGCTTVNTYVEPSSQNGIAFVKNHYKRNSMFDWQRSSLTSIDNKTISYAFTLSFDSYVARVTPGVHTFVIQSEFLRGFTSSPYSSIVELKASLNPGMNYFLNEAVDGAKIKVWLEDAAGNRRSEIASAPYRAVPINNVMVMPIIVK